MPGLRQVTAIWLPYPPSANRYLRHALRRTYRTAEANEYRKVVEREARLSGAPIIDGPVSIAVTLHPKMTKSGQAE